MTIPVTELIRRLQELPADWEIDCTKSGQSLLATQPGPDWWRPGARYARVFTVDKPTQMATRRAR